VATLDWGALKPQDAVLVLHPERELDYREVAAFLSEGGRLALLDDYGKGDALLKKFRILRVQSSVSPRESLRQKADLPVAVPATEMVAGAEQGRHPIVAEVERVVTNHPTGLRTEAGIHLTPVLRVPADGEADTLLAVIGVIGNAKRCGLVDEAATVVTSPGATAERCGRLFAMGDPSAVINLMLRYPGNRAFSRGLVDYLVANDSWGKRGGILYIAVNDVAQRGVYGGSSGVRRTLHDMVRTLEEWIAEARQSGLPNPLAVALGAIAALGAALYMARAATRIYRRPLPRYARPTPLVAQGGVAGRTAVLAAPTTHRALAVLELKAALEEELRDRLGLPASTATTQIVKEATAKRRLPAPIAADLGKLFAEMAKAETAVATSARMRISSDKVEQLRRRVNAVLAALGSAEAGAK
jgi:hypothetical protein